MKYTNLKLFSLIFLVGALAVDVEQLGLEAYNYQKISYCPRNDIDSWSCGSDCDKVEGMVDINTIEDTGMDT